MTDEDKKPVHHEIFYTDTVPVNDGGKKHPKETWDCETGVEPLSAIGRCPNCLNRLSWCVCGGLEESNQR